MSVTQRERRPVGSAEGGNGTPVSPSGFQTTRVPSYSSLPGLDRAGLSRLPQPTALRVRKQAEDRNVHVGRRDKSCKGILSNRIGVFLGKEEEFQVAVR